MLAELLVDSGAALAVFGLHFGGWVVLQGVPSCKFRYYVVLDGTALRGGGELGADCSRRT